MRTLEGVPPGADFQSFISRVTSLLGPVESEADPPSGSPLEITRAAVMLFLRPCPDHEPGDAGETTLVLFIKRAEREGDPWSGHVALPGGRAEETDASLLDSAVREAWEEVGIEARREGSILGRLPTLRPRRPVPALEVTPFVAALHGEVTIQTQGDEVAGAFWMPLVALKKGASLTVRYGDREFPAYPSPAGPIWGMTERILTGFLQIIG